MTVARRKGDGRSRHNEAARADDESCCALPRDRNGAEPIEKEKGSMGSPHKLSTIPVDVRERYANEIFAKSKVASDALLRAFASVPRERFVGPSPWKVLSAVPGQVQAQLIDVTDPVGLYHDVSVLLDPSRSLANGAPGTVAPWLDALELVPGKSVFHVGCGTGYYTAIMAEMVGSSGRVTAVEIDSGLAAQARMNLTHYPNVEVIEGDGAEVNPGSKDAILIHAGVTHPTKTWLDSLRPEGRLVLTLTVEFTKGGVGKGMVLRVSRLQAGYAAQFFPTPVIIYSCSGVRDSEIESLLFKALTGGNNAAVNSLRRELHSPEPECWLHTATFCLSTRLPKTNS
ncbi:MAG: protein-L-isoaspartate O-methyltransferase family protein [Gemmataceae bacterium]